jgi:ABC-type glycerol-3-phosphate transport system substrate-binding protein
VDCAGLVERWGAFSLYISSFSPLDPNDWAFNRFEEEKKGFKVNYTTINSEQVTLTLTWSALVVACAGRAFIALQTGVNFWAFLF